jgi:hypothetical protein
MGDFLSGLFNNLSLGNSLSSGPRFGSNTSTGLSTSQSAGSSAGLDAAASMNNSVNSSLADLTRNVQVQRDLAVRNMQLLGNANIAQTLLTAGQSYGLGYFDSIDAAAAPVESTAAWGKSKGVNA